MCQTLLNARDAVVNGIKTWFLAPIRIMSIQKSVRNLRKLEIGDFSPEVNFNDLVSWPLS